MQWWEYRIGGPAAETILRVTLEKESESAAGPMTEYSGASSPSPMPPEHPPIIAFPLRMQALSSFNPSPLVGRPLSAASTRPTSNRGARDAAGGRPAKTFRSLLIQLVLPLHFRLISNNHFSIPPLPLPVPGDCWKSIENGD